MSKTMKLVNVVLLLAMLSAGVAFAQPAVTRGGALKKRAYQTYAAVTLYVDPTGSDSNACTASGTSACLTLAGAVAKLPRFIRHAVTINVAAGTYAEGVNIANVYIDSTGSLSVTGSLTNFSVATGTATGTATGYSAASGTTHAALTDSGQTWTTNDLRGRFLQITGGTGSGQYRAISSNTGTVISLASAFSTSPTAGSTYAVVTPAAVFTSTSTIRGISGSSSLTLTDLGLNASSGSGLVPQGGGDAQLTLNRMRVTGTSGISGLLINPRNGISSATFTTNVFGGTSSGVTQGANSYWSFTDSLIYCTQATCAGGGFISNAVNSTLSAWTGTIAGDFTSGLFLVRGPLQAMQSTGLWLDCGATSNTAILFNPWGDTQVNAPAGFTANVGPFISGCSIGYSLTNPFSGVYIDNGTVFTNVTTAIQATRGARVLMEASPSFTGVTTEISIDGEAFTDANLTTYGRIVGAQQSFIARP